MHGCLVQAPTGRTRNEALTLAQALVAATARAQETADARQWTVLRGAAH